MVESADSFGTAVRYGYDVRGRIAAMIDAHGGTVRYEHNALNQLTSVTDQLGRQTIVTYDAAGRHLATTYRDLRAAMAPRAGASSRFGRPRRPVVLVDGAASTLAVTTSADGTVTTWSFPTAHRSSLCATPTCCRSG